METLPDGAALLPSNDDNVKASVTAASSVEKTSVLTASFAFASAEWSKGCTWLGALAASVSSAGTLALRPCFGDDDNVVTVVVAVRGLSPEPLDMAVCEDGGSLPVSSSFLMRDFKSSSSSQTVEGAAVERVDSVPSSRARSKSGRGRSPTSEEETCLLLPRIVDRVEFRYGRASRKVECLSTSVSGDAGAEP